jgi:hypothetical protein
MIMANDNWTSVQQRIMDVLSDGISHQKHDLLACIGDELATPNALQSHLTRMRLKLRPIGNNIICEIHDSRIYYRLVRVISNSD